MDFYKLREKVLNRSLTRHQMSIVNQDVYPKYIRASAGTGKTEVMIQKVIKLIKEHKVDISKLFIITFTNKSVNEVFSRLKERLYYEFLKESIDGNKEQALYIRNQIDKFDEKNVSTIHSFGKNLIIKYGMYADIPPSFEIKNFKVESSKIIRKNISECMISKFINSNDEKYIKRIVEYIIRFYSNRNEENMIETLNGFLFTNRNNRYWNDMKQVIIDICLRSYIDIHNSKIEKGIMTVNDIIPFVLRMLKDSECLCKIVDDIDVLFIDEFQDSDPGQVKIIDCMIDKGVKVCAFGDEKQSIYSFRGADLEFSSKVIDRIEGLNSIGNSNLNENFRTDPKLLEYINKIFSSDFYYMNSKLRFNYTIEESKVKTNRFDNPFRIVYKKKITEIIRGIIYESKQSKNEVKLEDINILCRSNAETEYIFDELSREGIKARILGGKSIYKEKCIKDVFKIFNAVINNEKAIIEELHYTDFYVSMCKLSGELGFKDFMDDLNNVFRICAINEILEYIYDQTGIHEYYKILGDVRSSKILNKLIEIASGLKEREYVHPIDLLEYLELMIDNDYKDQESFISEDEEGVCISTIHKTKGMSLPIVIIPNMDKDISRGKFEKEVIIDDEKKKIGIPIYKNDQEYDIDYFEICNEYINKVIEEELRILYVACTRAQNMLIMSSSKDEINNESWINWINNALN